MDPESSGHVEFRQRRRASARGRFREQVGNWYGRALTADPACGAAASSMVAVLAEDWLWYQDQAGYGWQEDRLRTDDSAGASLLAELKAAAERALAITPDDPVAVAGLAEAAWCLGDDAAAQRWYRTLLTLDPKDETAAERLATGESPIPETDGRPGFGFLVLKLDCVAAQDGDTVTEALVVSDPGYLRWGLRRMWSLDDEAPLESDELRVYSRGELVATFQSDSVDSLRDWYADRTPDVDDPRLPLGHPVRVDGQTYHHGYLVIPSW